MHSVLDLSHVQISNKRVEKIKPDNNAGINHFCKIQSSVQLALVDFRLAPATNISNYHPLRLSSPCIVTFQGLSLDFLIHIYKISITFFPEDLKVNKFVCSSVPCLKSLDIGAYV